ncbi:hypothetical protein D3C86_1390220 [compost metagenome]
MMTCDRPRTSMPRAATSVATRIAIWRWRKAWRVWVRWAWTRSPFRTPTLKPSADRRSAICSVSALVWQKQMASSGRSTCRTLARATNLAAGETS